MIEAFHQQSKTIPVFILTRNPPFLYHMTVSGVLRNSVSFEVQQMGLSNLVLSEKSVLVPLNMPVIGRYPQPRLFKKRLPFDIHMLPRLIHFYHWCTIRFIMCRKSIYLAIVPKDPPPVFHYVVDYTSLCQKIIIFGQYRILFTLLPWYSAYPWSLFPLYYGWPI